MTASSSVPLRELLTKAFWRVIYIVCGRMSLRLCTRLCHEVNRRLCGKLYISNVRMPRERNYSTCTQWGNILVSVPWLNGMFLSLKGPWKPVRLMGRKNSKNDNRRVLYWFQHVLVRNTTCRLCGTMSWSWDRLQVLFVPTVKPCLFTSSSSCRMSVPFHC